MRVIKARGKGQPTANANRKLTPTCWRGMNACLDFATLPVQCLAPNARRPSYSGTKDKSTTTGSSPSRRRMAGMASIQREALSPVYRFGTGNSRNNAMSLCHGHGDGSPAYCQSMAGATRTTQNIEHETLQTLQTC